MPPAPPRAARTCRARARPRRWRRCRASHLRARRTAGGSAPPPRTTARASRWRRTRSSSEHRGDQRDPRRSRGAAGSIPAGRDRARSGGIEALCQVAARAAAATRRRAARLLQRHPAPGGDPGAARKPRKSPSSRPGVEHRVEDPVEDQQGRERAEEEDERLGRKRSRARAVPPSADHTTAPIAASAARKQDHVDELQTPARRSSSCRAAAA